MADPVTETITSTHTANQDMELGTLTPPPDSSQPNSEPAVDEGSNPKRPRLEEDEDEEEEKNGESKKQKVEKSVEEESLEKLEGAEEGVNEEEKESCRVELGPKSFGSSLEMFDYFYKFLHFWSANLNVNKYEHVVLLELIKKGHPEPEKKIGPGICNFQVRYHPQFKSRCFFLVRDDESVDDFSFRKCVDRILPLPENMQIKSDVNKALGGHGGKGGRGGAGGHGGKGGGGGGRGWGRGRGRGGKWRN